MKPKRYQVLLVLFIRLTNKRRFIQILWQFWQSLGSHYNIGLGFYSCIAMFPSMSVSSHSTLQSGFDDMMSFHMVASSRKWKFHRWYCTFSTGGQDISTNLSWDIYGLTRLFLPFVLLYYNAAPIEHLQVLNNLTFGLR